MIDDPDRRPTLFVIGGLPASGKTTVSRALARRTGAAFVRVGTIEAAIVDQSSLEHPLGPVGYGVGYRVVADQLGLGLDTVVESVNPIAITRDAWLAVGQECGARVVEIEIICGDPEEHRRRAATRTLDIAGLAGPTWEEICDRAYEVWVREPVRIDTAQLSPDQAVHEILASGMWHPPDGTVA